MEKETLALTNFRSNLYSLVDQVIATGEPLLLERHGKIIEVRERSDEAPLEEGSVINDLSKIKPVKCMTEPAEWYISPKLYEWSGEIDPNIS